MECRRNAGMGMVRSDGDGRMQAPERKSSLTRLGRSTVLLLRLLPFLVLAALAWYQIPAHGSLAVGRVITFRHHALQLAAFGIAAAVWVLILAMLCWQGLRSRLLPKGWHRLTLIGVLVALPLLELLALGAMAFDWREVGRVQLPDGSIYRVRGSLPGYLLTQAVKRGPLQIQERIIGYGDKAFPALLVRPVREDTQDRWPPTGSSPTLVQSADGRWLVFLLAPRGGGADDMPSCQSHLVYDLRANRAYEVNDFADLSPFILIGPEDHLMPSDVQALLAGPRHVRPAGLNVIPPSPTTIARDLTNDNPEIRAAAARLLDTRNTQNSHLEDAARILHEVAASADDPVAQRAAEDALARLGAAR